MSKKPKRPRDPNQLAKFIVDAAVGEAALSEKPDDDKPGSRGGHARANKLTREQRQAIARKANAARWSNDREAWPGLTGDDLLRRRQELDKVRRRRQELDHALVAEIERYHQSPGRESSSSLKRLRELVVRVDEIDRLLRKMVRP
jgi:hypothetical protein